jgi:hypothetical protein
MVGAADRPGISTDYEYRILMEHQSPEQQPGSVRAIPGSVVSGLSVCRDGVTEDGGHAALPEGTLGYWNGRAFVPISRNESFDHLSSAGGLAPQSRNGRSHRALDTSACREALPMAATGMRTAASSATALRRSDGSSLARNSHGSVRKQRLPSRSVARSGFPGTATRATRQDLPSIIRRSQPAPSWPSQLPCLSARPQHTPLVEIPPPDDNLFESGDVDSILRELGISPDAEVITGGPYHDASNNYTSSDTIIVDRDDQQFDPAMCSCETAVNQSRHYGQEDKENLHPAVATTTPDYMVAHKSVTPLPYAGYVAENDAVYGQSPSALFEALAAPLFDHVQRPAILSNGPDRHAETMTEMFEAQRELPMIPEFTAESGFALAGDTAICRDPTPETSAQDFELFLQGMDEFLATLEPGPQLADSIHEGQDGQRNLDMDQYDGSGKEVPQGPTGDAME